MRFISRLKFGGILHTFYRKVHLPMSIALLTERAQLLDAGAKLDWRSSSDPVEVIKSSARLAAKTVFRLRSFDAVNRINMRMATKAAIEINDRDALIELRLQCVQYGFSRHLFVQELLGQLPSLENAFEARAERLHSAGAKKLFRAKAAEFIKHSRTLAELEGAFIGFLQAEVEPLLNEAIRALAKELMGNKEAIRRDINRRYPRITAHLAK